jgi:signal transduction histidine kinase
LVENQELMQRGEKLASLGMLAAGVAHEIRNPLTALKAALFIQRKRFQPDSAEAEESDLIQREILRLERIVNDFLKFARPSEPDLKLTNVNRILFGVQTLCGPELAKRKIQLLIEPAQNLEVNVDLEQMQQALLNLVQNAADAIQSDGDIKLRASSQEQNGGRPRGVIIEISDTGPGIPKEIQNRLFDPFFTTKDTGTGLGLSIAASIVQKHGGTFQFQTELGHGTTFAIVLPMADATSNFRQEIYGERYQSTAY